MICSKSYELGGVQCDKCKKVIHSSENKNIKTQEFRYYEVSLSYPFENGNWPEGIKRFDICPNCIDKFVKEYLDDQKYYRFACAEIRAQYATVEETIFE